MTCFIFIDESGDLGLRGSKYLVLACLIVSDDKPLRRLIKNARRHKFRKDLAKACEIKANKSSPEVVRYLLKQLNTVADARVFYILLEKKRVYSEFLRNNKHKLYNFVAGKLAKNLPLEDQKTIIRIDRSKDKQILREDFNKYFLRNLPPNANPRNIEIHHSWSHSWHGLQIADLLAWAMFQKFEHRNDEYVDLIEIAQEVYQTW
ncbi:MAG: DUF3800 domain-containing protein [Methanobacteriota archaeon]